MMIKNEAAGLLARLELEMRKLERFRTQLREFCGAMPSANSEDDSVALSARPKTNTTKEGKGGKNQASRKTVKGGVHERAKQLLAFTGTLQEPFKAKALRDHGFSNAGTYTALERWKGLGWIKGSNAEGWTRTNKWPAETLNAQRAQHAQHAPHAVLRDGRNRKVIEQELAAACQQRDHARENGRSQMVDMFQSDVDRLEGELETLT